MGPKVLSLLSKIDNWLLVAFDRFVQFLWDRAEIPLIKLLRATFVAQTVLGASYDILVKTPWTWIVVGTIINLFLLAIMEIWFAVMPKAQKNLRVLEFRSQPMLTIIRWTMLYPTPLMLASALHLKFQREAPMLEIVVYVLYRLTELVASLCMYALEPMGPPNKPVKKEVENTSALPDPAS